MVHAVNISLSKCIADKIFRILHIEFENAFVTINRKHMLDQVSKHFPNLSAFVKPAIPNTALYTLIDILRAELKSSKEALGQIIFKRSKDANLVQNSWNPNDGLLCGTEGEKKFLRNSQGEQ